MRKIINYLTGVCVLWVLLMVFTCLVSLVGSIIMGWVAYIKSFFVINFFGTLIISFLLELYFNNAPERREDGREESAAGKEA